MPCPDENLEPPVRSVHFSQYPGGPHENEGFASSGVHQPHRGRNVARTTIVGPRIEKVLGRRCLSDDTSVRVLVLRKDHRRIAVASVKRVWPHANTTRCWVASVCNVAAAVSLAMVCPGLCRVISSSVSFIPVPMQLTLQPGSPRLVEGMPPAPDGVLVPIPPRRHGGTALTIYQQQPAIIPLTPLPIMRHRGLSHDSLTSQTGNEGSARDITCQIDCASMEVICVGRTRRCPCTCTTKFRAGHHDSILTPVDYFRHQPPTPRSPRRPVAPDSCM
jgi:hypothetical protein